MSRAGAVSGAGVVLVVLLGVLALVQWAGRDRAEFTPGSAAALEQAVDAAGLRICAVTDVPRDRAGGSVAGRAYEVAAACPGDAATVVVDRYGSAADRDAAARRFESLLRPRSSGTVLTLGDATVLLQGAGDGGVRQRLVEALRDGGAR